MNANVLALYFKLNLLIVAAFLLWVLTKQLAGLLRFEVNHAQQLKVARTIIAGLLLCVPLFAVLNGLLPGWLKGIEAVVSKPGLIQAFTFTTGMTDLLGNRFRFGMLTLDPQFFLSALMIAGLLIQIVRMTIQVSRLRKIVNDATEWKSISGIHLLISGVITSPFSTRVLGSKQIVLPAQLLEVPTNLRLAIKHELQHVRNGDLDWVILLEAINMLCFWNPFAWLWHNEFDCLQEFACDEVLVNERKVNSQAYGTCLLDVAGAVTGRALLASSNMVPKFSLWQNHKNQLKRRILMLTNASKRKNSTFKSVCYGILVGFGLVSAAAAVFAADAGGSNATAKGDNKKDVIPVTRVNPRYPASALKDGLGGSVVVDFTIDEAGNVKNAVATRSCIWPRTDAAKTCREDDMFKATSLAAINEWKYKPRIENGVAVKREHVQTMLLFQLDDDAPVKQEK